MSNFWDRLPTWLYIVLYLLSLLLVFPLIGKAFRAFTLLFLVTWLLIPIILGILLKTKCLNWLSSSVASKFRAICLGLSILISFCFFANFNLVRDRVGHMFVEGYSSYYYPDVDEYGREDQAVDVSTAHWYSRFLLWLGEWGYLAFCVLMPYLTWKIGSLLVVSVEKKLE